MILELPETTVSQISKTLVRLREEGGVVALGRVLTLVISTTSDDEAEEAISAANDASREHPMRLIVINARPHDDDSGSRLDAEIRVGGDAGASEVVILRAAGGVAQFEETLVTGLLLPDAPVVVWWPGVSPAIPGESPLGKIAQRRITDAAAAADPQRALDQLRERYRPGDVDFAWTRTTLWRTQLAAVLDQPPYQTVTSIDVEGDKTSASTTLLAAWLALQLDVPTRLALLTNTKHGGISRVVLAGKTGEAVLRRDESRVATLIQDGQPDHLISLPRRSLRDCLAEELRRLDPDDTFGRVLSAGLSRVHH